jgi:hypothetical protein
MMALRNAKLKRKMRKIAENRAFTDKRGHFAGANWCASARTLFDNSPAAF